MYRLEEGLKKETNFSFGEQSLKKRMLDYVLSRLIPLFFARGSTFEVLCKTGRS